VAAGKGSGSATINNDGDDVALELPLPFLRPWYRGFKGEIKVMGSSYMTKGVYHRDGNDIVIDELPIGVAPIDYFQKFMEKLVEDKLAKKAENKCPADAVRLLIKGYTEKPNHLKLKLINKGSFKNMTVLIPGFIDGKEKFTIHTYNNIQDMLLDFAEWRLSIYYKRQEYQAAKIRMDLDKLKEKLRLVIKIREGDNRQVLFIDKGNQDIQLKQWGFETDILKGTPSNSYTPQLISKLEEEVLAKQKELDNLLKVSPEVTWAKELEEFSRAYAKHYKLQPISYADIEPPTEVELYGPKKRVDTVADPAGAAVDDSVDQGGEEIRTEADLEALEEIPAEPEFQQFGDGTDEAVDVDKRRAAWYRQHAGTAAGSDDDEWWVGDSSEEL